MHVLRHMLLVLHVLLLMAVLLWVYLGRLCWCVVLLVLPLILWGHVARRRVGHVLLVRCRIVRVVEAIVLLWFLVLPVLRSRSRRIWLVRIAVLLVAVLLRDPRCRRRCGYPHAR